MSIYIPEKIKVGYQDRSDTYTGKLAYVIYYDEKNKLRKEKSWNGWRDNTIDPNDFDNEPTRGFVLNKKVGDYGGSWGEHRHAYCRIYDPRGFEFEITIENLLFILEHADCLRGKGLDGEFVYGWDGKDLVLIPVDSPDYKEIKTLTDKIQNGKRFKGNDLIIGATYLTKNEEKWVYMGRFDKWEKLTNCFRNKWYWSSNEDREWEFNLDDTWTLIPNDKNTAYKHVNKGKYYWFYNGNKNNYSHFKRYNFETRKSIGDILIDCIDEKPSQCYAEYFDDLENNHFDYNPIDFTSEVLLDLSYDKFIERLGLGKYTTFLNSSNKRIEVCNENNGTYLYNKKKYLPSELYEEIKPKYELYKHIDGKEFHNYCNNNLIYY